MSQLIQRHDIVCMWGVDSFSLQLIKCHVFRHFHNRGHFCDDLFLLLSTNLFQNPSRVGGKRDQCSLFPDNNARISPASLQHFVLLHKIILLLLPKSLKSNTASLKLPENIQTCSWFFSQKWFSGSSHCRTEPKMLAVARVSVNSIFAENNERNGNTGIYKRGRSGGDAPRSQNQVRKSHSDNAPQLPQIKSLLPSSLK